MASVYDKDGKEIKCAAVDVAALVKSGHFTKTKPKKEGGK